jgi:signal transduction histidine kinase
MAADAKLKGQAYLERMKRTLWPLVREYWFDALVVSAAIAGALEIAVNPSAPDSPDLPLGVAIPIEMALTLALLARRRFPFGAPAGVFVAGAALSFLDGRLVTYTAGGFLTALAACFLLGMLEERRQALTGLGIALGAIFIIMWHDPTRAAGDAIFTPLLFTTVWLFAFGLGRKLEQAREAEERAARREREREDEARAAVAAERARIARELHDVVGHSVSVMTVQASGVRRLLKPDQEREREALLIVEQAGREALAEMRRLVGVLRRPEEAPALAPQPSLQHLDRLIEQAGEAGLPVRVQVEGEPSDLPAGVDLTAYRLVQEALTNAIKHAGASSAEVIVRYGDGAVELLVADDGRGELEAGPKPDGGFALRARLPIT